MAQSYIPAKEAAFFTWSANFSTLLSAAPTTYGLVAADAAALATLQAAYVLAYNAAKSGATRGPATIASKDAARANLTARDRLLAGNIQRNVNVTNTQKTSLGITVRKTSKTPSIIPTTSPILSFIGATPGQHTLRWADQNTPALRAKPFGVYALALWAQSGGVTPTDVPTMTFVGMITKQPTPVNLQPTSKGLVVSYLAKWVTRSGQYGPLSNVLQATAI